MSAHIVAGLNPEQERAVLHNQGPLLILAGAGSGKTSVLTRRIARLVADGSPAYSILAVTFTNKAAREMRERVEKMIPEGAGTPLVSTFHSFCVKLLRTDSELAGLTRSFTIYDS